MQIDFLGQIYNPLRWKYIPPPWIEPIFINDVLEYLLKKIFK